jgi:hypothetical protein
VGAIAKGIGEVGAIVPADDVVGVGAAVGAGAAGFGAVQIEDGNGTETEGCAKTEVAGSNAERLDVEEGWEVEEIAGGGLSGCLGGGTTSPRGEEPDVVGAGTPTILITL